jgi:hypothetical protein
VQWFLHTRKNVTPNPAEPEQGSRSLTALNATFATPLAAVLGDQVLTANREILWQQLHRRSR